MKDDKFVIESFLVPSFYWFFRFKFGLEASVLASKVSFKSLC